LLATFQVQCTVLKPKLPTVFRLHNDTRVLWLYGFSKVVQDIIKHQFLMRTFNLDLVLHIKKLNR